MLAGEWTLSQALVIRALKYIGVRVGDGGASLLQRGDVPESERGLG